MFAREAIEDLKRRNYCVGGKKMGKKFGYSKMIDYLCRDFN